MIIIKQIVIVLLGLALFYLIGRIFTRGAIDEIEKHFKSHYKHLQKTKKDGTEI
jgi:membrane protein DedA with SNARE-associated domain